MAITTDSTVNITSGGITYDRIGFSKTLDNYSIDEILAFTYCAGDNTLIKHITEKQNDTLVNTLAGVDVPVHVEQYSATIMVANAGIQANENQGEKGVYCGVVWLSKQSAGLRYVITSTSISDYKIVTEFRAKDYVYDLNSPAKINCGGQIYGTTNWSGSDQTAHEVWYSTGGSLVYYSDNYGTVTIDVSSYRIDPYLVFKYNNKVYLFKLTMAINEFYSNHNNGYADPVTASSYSSYDETTAISVSAAIEQLWDSTWSNTDWNFPEDWTKTGGGAYGWSYTGLCFDAEISQYGLVNGTNSGLYSGCSLKFYFNTRDAALDFWKCCGVKFYADKIYKPIIADGYVTGYTDNLDTASELDNWTGAANHSIPAVRPSGGGGSDEDNNDPISTNGAPFAAGLCHYYALTAGSVLLDHISEALGTWDIENTHKDLYKNLVSCKLIKPPAAIPTTGSEPFTIYGVKPQYQGADITLPVVSGNPDASFGPYSIDRKFNDFRDYAPYTRVSIYLPCCGWCDLPSHVVGRSVSVHYFTDIIAATCKAVVFCGNNIVAEAAGVIGLDIPFVADNVGAKMQAVTAGMIAALGGGIQLGAGIGTMVSMKSGSGAKAALSGASQYLSGYSQMAMAFNENTTEISGKNGDGCCLAGATNIIIKIVRPKKGAYTTAPYTPPGYGHNVGYVSQKQVRVGNVSGLLIADNVDTSGIAGATEAERAEIKRVLETGLIVNAAPE